MTRASGGVPVQVRRDLARLARLSFAARRDLLARGAAASSDEAAVIDAVSHWVYQAWYLAAGGPDGTPDRGPDHRLLPSALRAALPGATRWLQPWVVLDAREDGVCVAGRRGEARELRCGEYANVSRPGVPPSPGDAVAVADCVDHVDWETGFWTARSPAAEPAAPLVRVYWSVGVSSVGAVLRGLGAVLDESGVRWSLKCPVRSRDFDRVDALVLYLERAAWRSVARALTSFAHQCGQDLRPGRPPLTRPLARGVGFAEDPGGGESFGQSRCRALATGLVAWLRHPSPVVEGGVDAMVRALRRAAIDPARPWVHAGA